MPAASIESVTPSETSGTKSRNASDPNMVGTPAVRFRSLIAVGTPHSGPSPALSAVGPLARLVGRRGDEGADVVEPVHPVEVVVGELERRDLALPDQLALLERGQVVQLGHAADAIPALRLTPCRRSTGAP